MTGKERINITLKRGEPDRVPTYEAAFSDALASEIMGRSVFVPSDGGASQRYFLRARIDGLEALTEAAQKSARDGIALYSRLGIDMIRVRITDFLTPVDFGYGNFGSRALFDSDVEEKGENLWRIEGAEGFWSDHIYEPQTDSMMCIDHAIKKGGIEEFKRYVELLERLPSGIPVEAVPGLAGVKEAVKEARGEGIFVVGWGDVAYPGASPWLVEFLTAMSTEPELIHRYMEATTEGAITFIKAQIDAGVDGILGGNDWCFKTGPMFSPEYFSRFFVPHLKRIASFCHEKGVPYIKHLDGNTTSLLPALINDVGIDAYHGIEPPAGMNIVELKKQYGKQITLMGNLDCGSLLSNGTPEEVESEAKRIIQAVSPGGGHIFGSSNSIHDGVRLENLYAMLNSVETYGVYPIREDL